MEKPQSSKLPWKTFILKKDGILSSAEEANYPLKTHLPLAVQAYIFLLTLYISEFCQWQWDLSGQLIKATRSDSVSQLKEESNNSAYQKLKYNLQKDRRYWCGLNAVRFWHIACHWYDFEKIVNSSETQFLI